VLGYTTVGPKTGNNTGGNEKLDVALQHAFLMPKHTKKKKKAQWIFHL